jgi:hypothetical protein
MLQALNVRNIEAVLVAVVVITPDTLLPETLYDVRLVLVVLRITVLTCRLAREFSIDGIASPFEDKSTTLEILRGTILSLILALRVCAHLHYCY